MIKKKKKEGKNATARNIHITSTGAQVAISVTISLLSSLIPRRPNVFQKGIIVDRQFTTSLLGRVSFSWIEPVLRETEHLNPQLSMICRNWIIARGEKVYTVYGKEWQQSAVYYPAAGIYGAEYVSPMAVPCSLRR